MTALLRTFCILIAWFVIGFVASKALTLPIIPTFIGVAIVSIFTSIVAEFEDWFNQKQGSVASAQIAFMVKSSGAAIVALLGLISFLLIPEQSNLAETWTLRTGFLVVALSISAIFLSRAHSRTYFFVLVLGLVCILSSIFV